MQHHVSNYIVFIILFGQTRDTVFTFISLVEKSLSSSSWKADNRFRHETY